MPDDYSGSRRYWLSDSDFRKNNKQKHYQHLHELNEGRQNGDSWYNDVALVREENRHLIDIITAQLDLTVRQRERAKGFFCSLDLQSWGIRKVVIAYSLCAFLVKTDERNEARKTHPNVTKESMDALFVKMADSLGISDREFHKTYAKVQHKLRGYTFHPRVERTSHSDPSRRRGT